MTAVEAKQNLNNAVKYTNKKSGTEGVYKLLAVIVRKNEKNEMYIQAEIRELFGSNLYYVSLTDLEVI